jgi:tetratricopeptide (TPR) repeat protein
MIKRMPKVGQEQVTIALWHALGEIYRSRLRDINAAIQTFEVAVSLEPDNLKRHEILAELYNMAGPDFIDKAVKEQMFLIGKDAFKIESYSALYDIYFKSGQYDKAWCMASALTYLQRANPDQTQFYEQYKSKGLVRAKSRLTDEMWAKYVYHPDEDRFVGAIYAAVYRAVGMMKSGEHKQFGLKRKEKRDLASDQATIQQGLHLRDAGAECAHRPGNLLPTGSAGRATGRQLSREAAVHPVDCRRAGHARGPQ